MKDLKELKEQFNKKQEELNKLSEQIEKAEKASSNKRHRVDNGDAYYYINELGIICGHNEWFDNVDNYLYSMGNYYLSEEDCQKALDVQNTECELRELAKELNADEEIDWNNENQPKFYIFYAFSEKSIYFGRTYTVKHSNDVNCLDDDFLSKAIAKIGKDRLVEYLTYEW